MTTANAPYPNYNGIPYNRAFFTSPTTTLTQGQADTRYLQKNSQDTATSLEIFSGGIITQGLTISSGSNINLPTGAGFNFPGSSAQQGYIVPGVTAYQQVFNYGPWVSNKTYNAFNNLQLPAGFWIVYYNFRLYSTPSILAYTIEAFITSSLTPALKLATQSMQNQTIGLPVSGMPLYSPAFSGCCFLSLNGYSNINVSVIINSTSLPSGNGVSLFVGNTTSTIAIAPNEVANLYAMRIA